jgi:hypothetical protein
MEMVRDMLPIVMKLFGSHEQAVSLLASSGESLKVFIDSFSFAVVEQPKQVKDCQRSYIRVDRLEI